MQNISSSVSNVSTNNLTVISQKPFTALSNTKVTAKADSEILTPEQKNTLQDDFNAKITEQANKIKSNFQTAKDIDLTRAYYDQQQKLVDIYMQSDTTSNSKNNVTVSATKTLIDTYDSLYQLHKTIKAGVSLWPTIPDDIKSPVDRPEIQPVETTVSPTNKLTDTYNSFMMPTTNSYLSLSA